MKMGNDWREFSNFMISHRGKNWEIESINGGYLVYTFYDTDEQEDSPVPKFFRTLRNGDKDSQDVESFNEGLYEALWSDDATFYVIGESL